MACAIFGPALAHASADAEMRPVTGCQAGISFGALSYGGLLEADLRNRYAIQYQYFNYSEFQGIFPKNEDRPAEEYRINGLNAGIFTDLSNLRIGIFLGAQYVDGVVRGKFLREQPWMECGWFGGACTDSGANRIYDPIEINRILVPLKLSAGFHWGWFGLTFSPQLYLYDERIFYHLECNALFGRF